jgi:inorganic pyrophosphatase
MRFTNMMLAAGLALPLYAAAAEHHSPVQTGSCNVTRVAQPATAPAALYALIEIPAGSTTKYEIDPATGFLLVDRFQSMPVVYPANYGALPSTLAGDGDSLDVVVYTREPIVPGALIPVRPIGILKMIDGGEEDDKVVAVPRDDVDPSYALIRDLTDLPEIERQRLVSFFQTYKQLPKGRKVVEIRQVGGYSRAVEAIRESLARYQQAGVSAEACTVN